MQQDIITLHFQANNNLQIPGPRDFKVQYKIGSGGTWTDVTGSSVTVANNFTSGVLTDIALPAGVPTTKAVCICVGL